VVDAAVSTSSLPSRCGCYDRLSASHSPIEILAGLGAGVTGDQWLPLLVAWGLPCCYRRQRPGDGHAAAPGPGIPASASPPAARLLLLAAALGLAGAVVATWPSRWFRPG
jgi:hypothetical protein